MNQSLYKVTGGRRGTFYVVARDVSEIEAALRNEAIRRYKDNKNNIQKIVFIDNEEDYVSYMGIKSIERVSETVFMSVAQPLFSDSPTVTELKPFR